MAKKNKSKLKLPKKPTPGKIANEETQERERQRKKTLQAFDGIGNMMTSTETRSKEDVNQAAARTVRELTQGKRES
jgi:hypothetical protein